MNKKRNTLGYRPASASDLLKWFKLAKTCPLTFVLHMIYNKNTVIASISLFQLKNYQFFLRSKQWAAVRTYWYAIKTPPHHIFPRSTCDGAYFTWSSNDNFIDTKNGYKSLFLTSVPLKILGLGFLYLAWKNTK